MARFEIVYCEEEDHNWMWRLIATDGQYLCTSLLQFDTPEQAHVNIKKVKKAALMRTKVEIISEVYENN